MAPRESLRDVGLARALSKLGYCSRSQAARLIRDGRVRLNGAIKRNPEAAVHLGKDRVLVDDHPITPTEKIYLVMNKPRGVVTTASDEKGRETVYDLLVPSEDLPWVAPVGRLDKASEGLMLLTNDSEWAAKITNPDTHLQKTYHVQINKVVDDHFTRALINGVLAEDGEMLHALGTRLLRSGEKNCWLEIVLDEGKNRQIRRMLSAFEVEVLRLVRVGIGPLQLGKLSKGSYRILTKEEKLALDRAMPHD